MARNETTTITPPEALSVLLQSWNARYYVSQHHGRFPREHFKGLEKLLKHHEHALAAYRSRSIESLAAEDREAIEALFADFEALLGPVGAAKALHLLAPRFFPLWDRDIAINNDCRIGRAGTNASRYWALHGVQPRRLRCAWRRGQTWHQPSEAARRVQLLPRPRLALTKRELHVPSQNLAHLSESGVHPAPRGWSASR